MNNPSPSSGPHVLVAGGGAAGFFAAIACAEANPAVQVDLHEKSSHFLIKVAKSGGGRCNVTHALFEPRPFATRFPRGERPLIGALHRFSAADTVAWFAERGVTLKTEPDGRMFPVTDRSETIVACLHQAAIRAGVRLHARDAVTRVFRAKRGFIVETTGSGDVACDRLILATGGSRVPDGARIAVELGHRVFPAVPSLFTFHVDLPWLRELPGISVNPVRVEVPGTSLRETGPVLVTHWGLSGPAVLRLSAWGARLLAERDYHFPLRLNWLPDLSLAEADARLLDLRERYPARLVQTPLPSSEIFGQLPGRLWEQLCRTAEIPAAARWNTLSRPGRRALATTLTAQEIVVSGKSLNKEEFVTCGGVDCGEVDFRSMESRLCPGLYFAGELLDLDGITGGFNFQAAWTTGLLAGRAAGQAGAVADLPQ